MNGILGRGSGCLECTCKVININRGHNIELMDNKGKSPEVIAEELEEDLETVRDLLKRL